MADAFTPRFVDLVRNTTTTVGTGNFVLGPAASGFTSFAGTIKPGESFYYSAIGVDKPAEREIGRGTMQADGTISRDPIGGTLTSFTTGTKTIALVAAAEWFETMQASPVGGGAGTGEAGTRSALSASERALPVVLCEPGREGLFVFDGADFSTLVTADTAQGIYVAPSSDTTGASGAWIRQFTGPVIPEWFGIVKDDAGAAAANSTAWTALMNTLNARATIPATWYHGLGTVQFGLGKYHFNSTLDIKAGTIVIEGLGPTVYGIGTGLKFPAGVTGIRVQNWDTSGASATEASDFRRANGTTIRDLALSGGYAGTEGEYHGIQLRGQALIDNVEIVGFEGDGIYGNASVGGVAYRGNINNTTIRNARVTGCRNGIALDGSDANVVKIIGGSLDNNREWGLKDGSIGAYVDGVHFDANGHTQAGAESWCGYNGKIYIVKWGQEAGASTNPPSGTNADNMWWIYSHDGPPGGWAPAWVSGMTWRAGGSVLSKYEGVTGTVGIFCYTENEGPPQGLGPTLFFGGSIPGRKKVGGGTYFNHSQGTLEIRSPIKAEGGLTADGHAALGSPTELANSEVTVRTAGTFGIFQAAAYSGGVFQRNLGSIAGYNNPGADALIYSAPDRHYFKVGGATVGDSTLVGNIGPEGLSLVSGKGITIAGTPVIDGSRNGSFAAITATGTVTAANLSGTNTGDQTITLTGDVTGSGQGSFAATIANDSVTYAKLQNVSTSSRLLGRISAGAGDVEELTGAQVRSVSGLVMGLGFHCAGKPAAGEVIGGWIAPYAFTISAANSAVKALIAATASAVVTIKKNGTQIGTATFAAGGTSATVSISSANVAAGDQVTLHAPATADTTLADIDGLLRE